MKNFNFFTIVAFFFLAIMNLNTCKKTTEERPHIILCMADDQGWGDVAYNGHPILQTPNLDNLANSALRFDHFYAAAPLCSPTRGSVMTGRHPNRFGCFMFGKTLRPQEITIAEALKSAGYVTGHFGKWHLGSVMKGSPVNPAASGFDEWLSSPNDFDNHPVLSREGIAVKTKGESSLVIVDAALEFIRKHAGSDKPVFAVIWFGSPHKPHKPFEEDKALYDGQESKFQNYYGEITGMDRAMGKLRQELKNMGIAQNTLLWYCSDNGGTPAVGSNGGRGHKRDIYEGGIRVPAIIEWPAKIKQPRISKFPANTSDIFPTLMEITGINIKDQPILDGVSVMDVIEDKNDLREDPMGFWQYPSGGRGTPSKKWMRELLEVQTQGKVITDSARLVLDAGIIDYHYPEDSFPGHAAWLDWPYKLHRIKNEEGGIKLELYNLEQDSLEQNDLSDMSKDRINKMLIELEKWQESVIKSLNGKDYH